jgi:tripartite-type tricarboxylate transporter receptor subunit TctC
MRERRAADVVRTVALALCSLLSFVSLASGLDYPTKAVQIMVPYPPGGTNDITARILEPKLASLLGQTVVVVNKPGGGGAVGIKAASAAKPDGYTLLTSPPGIVMIPILNPTIGFNLEDFTPVGLAVSIPSVITVKADAPWKTLDDLIKDMKENPGKLTYSTAGPGTTPHFAGELLKIETGTDMVHVPMGGEAPAAAAALGGHVDMTFVTLGAVSAHLRAGTLRALALMYPKRISDFPDIPTTKELGYPRLMTTAWHGYFFPAKTPGEIVTKMARAFEAALKDKEVIAKIEQAGMLPEGMILEDANKFFHDEQSKWSDVAKRAKMVEKETK